MSLSDSVISVGQIRSKKSNYDYGYFEISSKILDPGNYRNGIACATGVWPSFWTYWVDYSRHQRYHDEIDIVETLYNKCEDVRIMSGGVHDLIPEGADTSGSKSRTVKVYSIDHRHIEPLFEEEHKYAAEWLRDRVIFYFDDQPVGAYRGDGLPKHMQYVVLSMQINNKWVLFDQTITSPQDMNVDYFRYYHLIDRYCEKDAKIKNNSQLKYFKFGLRRNITIGNGFVWLSAGETKTFRAWNEITVTGDFSVPTGAELNLIPTPCH
jgi:beta-glucanase (GH16 family)